MPILISKKWMSIVRAYLGLYLLWMWSSFWTHTTSIFSSQGMFHGYSFPWGFNVIEHLPDTGIKLCLILLISLTLASVKHPRPWIWIALWYGWFCFCSRIPFYVNPPNVGYIGFLLLCLSLTKEKEDGSLEVPGLLWKGMWVIMGLSYTVSGVGKILSSENWQAGSTLILLLKDSFIQKDNFLVHLSLAFPGVMVVISYFTLLAEAGFAFLLVNKWSRWIALISMTLVHLGILFLLKIDSIPLGMLLFHLFMFSGTSLPWRNHGKN